MGTTIKKQTVYSNTKKSRTVKYFFETDLGFDVFEKWEEGRFSGMISDKLPYDIKMHQVPKEIQEEFRNSGIFPSKENFEYYEKELERREMWFLEERRRKAEEEEKRLRREAEIESELSKDICLVSFENIVNVITEIFSGSNFSPETVVKEGVKITFHNLEDNFGIVKKMKVVNPNWGLSFKIVRRTGQYDITHLLNTSFRFVFEVCFLGRHIKNKELLKVLSKKNSKPTFETLRKAGFVIDKKIFDTINLETIEGIKVLLESYPRT